MAERVQMIVKHITFGEADRDALTFSDTSKIYQDVPSNTVQLRPDTSGSFPLDANISVLGAVTTVGAFRAFTGFQADVKQETVEGLVATSVGFRLSDGSFAWWWDGAQWSQGPSPGQWNTEDEIAAHIATFAVPRTNGGTFGVYINLATTDKTVTPKLREVKFGVNVKMHSWMDDIIFRSLVVDLAEKIRPVTDFAYSVPAAGMLTVDIGALVSGSGLAFNVVGVESCFNLTDDPGLVTNLATTYNPTSKILSLNSAPPPGKVLQIGLIYQPQVVAQMTHQDFQEVEKVPAIILNEIALSPASRLQQDDFVMNKATAAALIVPAPYQGTVGFKIDVLAPGAVDLLRLTEAITEYAENNPLLMSRGLGESFRFWLKDEFSNQSRPGPSDVHTAQCSAEVKDIVLFKRAAQAGYGIKNPLRFANPVVPRVRVSPINPPLIDTSDVSGPDVLTLWFEYSGIAPDSGAHTLYWEAWFPGGVIPWINGTINFSGDAAQVWSVDMFFPNQQHLYGDWVMHVWLDVFNPILDSNETVRRVFSFHG